MDSRVWTLWPSIEPRDEPIRRTRVCPGRHWIGAAGHRSAGHAPQLLILEPAILEPAILEPAILEPAILEPAILEPAILEPSDPRTSRGGDQRPATSQAGDRSDRRRPRAAAAGPRTSNLEPRTSNLEPQANNKQTRTPAPYVASNEQGAAWNGLTEMNKASKAHMNTRNRGYQPTRG